MDPDKDISITAMRRKVMRWRRKMEGYCITGFHSISIKELKLKLGLTELVHELTQTKVEEFQCTKLELLKHLLSSSYTSKD